MRALSVLIGVVASVALFGCAASNKEASSPAEANPWADYKGTFAAGVPGAPSAAEAKPSAPQTDKTETRGTASAASTASAAKGEEAPPPRKVAAKKRPKAGAKTAPSTRAKN